MAELTFDKFLEVLAEKLADRLSQEPGRLFPRLLTIDQAAIYLGRTREAVQRLASSEKVPTVRATEACSLIGSIWTNGSKNTNRDDSQCKKR